MAALPLPGQSDYSTQTPGSPTVWSWSGIRCPETQLLTDPVLRGIGSGGPGFNQYQWRELEFVINFMREFRQLTENEATLTSG